MASEWLGAATGRLIVTSAAATPKRLEDEVLALIEIVSAAIEIEPAGKKNGAVLPGPSTARTGELIETVEGVRVRSKIIDCVTSCPGETVNERGATSAGGPVKTAHCNGRSVTSAGAVDHSSVMLPLSSETRPWLGFREPRSLLKFKFHAAPGDEAYTRPDAVLPLVSFTVKIAENVPGTMPSLVPISMSPEVFGKKTVLPGAESTSGAAVNTSCLPLVT